jgi:predicted dehydrogenase
LSERLLIAGESRRAGGGGPGTARPRLGFLGTGWIGRARLRSLVDAGAGEVVAIVEPDEACAREARAIAPGALAAEDLHELLAAGLDGVVIATPSALHAEQAIAALAAGVAVFCQKPLGRNAGEVGAVIGAARSADRLLGVDLSYRATAAARALRDRLAAEAIGPVHAVELVFHNAYGPDKPWFSDPVQSGGGCLIDLGIHLVDLLLWMLDFPSVERVEGNLWRGGALLAPGQTEDFCLATLQLSSGAVARIACSWFSHEGRDAVIEATFRGRDGALSMHNVDGSFYDLAAELRRGTVRERIASPPDAWGGRQAIAWSERLACGCGFDPEADRLLDVAETIDRVYAS